MKRSLPLVLAVLLAAGGARAQAAEESVIDVAVFYTTAAKNAEGGTTQIKAVIDMYVEAANMAYDDGAVDQRLNLAYAGEVDYTETSDYSADLDRLRVKNDGYMDEVHAIREQVWADVVMLVQSNALGGGIAYVMDSVATTFKDHAFGVVGRIDIHFVHEVGHIMGVNHDRYTCAVSGCDGSSRYAHGYVNQKAFVSGAADSARWHTIMSGNSQCAANGFNCDHIPRFSNPNQTYKGDPLGVALTDSNKDSGAVDGPADAVRRLNATRRTVAEFRQGRAVEVSFAEATYTATEGGAAAQVKVQFDGKPGRSLRIPLRVATNDGRSGEYAVSARSWTSPRATRTPLSPYRPWTTASTRTTRR